jgi:excisionase family DNA binding protein
MATTAFLTSLGEEEFKSFLKEALKEILDENNHPSAPKQPEILDIRQAAEYLKLKVTTLYEKTSQRLIPHFKKGKRLYFHLSELQDWVKEGKIKTRQELQNESITYSMQKEWYKRSGRKSHH